MNNLKKKCGNLTKVFLPLLLCSGLLLSACAGSATSGAATTSAGSGESESAVVYTPGTYTGTATGRNGEVTVEVTFSTTAIETVTVVEHAETEGIAEAPVAQIPAEIVGQQSLNIDAVSGATITSQAILNAVADAVTQAGGDAAALQNKEKPQQAGELITKEADIVVIGAGAAGTTAALAAIDKGASVILLEKTATPMGASTLAGGLFAADSTLQQDAGKTVSTEWLYQQYVEASGGFMNSILVRTIIDESGATVDYIVENGVELAVIDAGAGAFAHIGMPATLHGYQEGGTVAINNLVSSFENKGGEIYFNTPATALMYDDNHNVSGVIATDAGGNTLEISANAVIIATGGYGGNEEMLQQYIGANYTMGQVTTNTGDGILMAWDAGADEYGIGTTQYFWQTFRDEEMGALIGAVGVENWFTVAQLSFLPFFRVNNLGQRFSDETNATLFAIHGAELHMQPNEEEYLILDMAAINKMKEGGTAAIEEQFAAFIDNPQFYMEFNAPSDTDTHYALEHTPIDYEALLDAALESGVVFRGETIEELAAATGIDADTLAASVQQYNDAAASGEDTLFFTDASRMQPLVEGPFYAVKFSARNLGTLGGVRINENIEAVDANGVAIPGLYVAGADAGGMYGGTYVNFEGGTLGFAYTSGRLAGENAADYVAAQA